MTREICPDCGADVTPEHCMGESDIEMLSRDYPRCDVGPRGGRCTCDCAGCNPPCECWEGR